MAAVSFALSAALLWGVADFAGGFFSRRLSAVMVVLVLETGGLLGVSIVLAAVGEELPDGRSIGLACLAGVAGAGGLAAFFRGMALGAMAVVSPVFASGSAVVPVVVGLATGDRVTTLVGLGIALAALGILLASLESEHEAVASRATRRAIAFALLGAVGAAIFILCSDVASDGSVLWTLFFARAAAIPVLALAVAGRGIGLPVRRDALAILGVGLVDLGATAAFGLATTKGALAIVAVLGGMYPVVTATLAATVLRERIRRVQVAGVAFALLGVVLVAVG